MSAFIEQKRVALAKHLRGNIQGEIRFDAASRRLYSTDASIYQIEPLGVVIPRTVPDLVTAVQIALEMHIPIIARGGGTSLSGQSIGPGMILDCSKYLNQILDIDPSGRKVRLQPGVILDQLNAAVARHGLQFGPDVATANRANVGGMIGNNSAGARSIVYGKMIDHVRELKVVLSDGTHAEFSPIGSKEWDRRAQAKSLQGIIYRAVRRIVQTNADEIQKRFPRILRRVSGYNLDAVLPALHVVARSPDRATTWQGQETLPRPVNPEIGLEKLIVGSEGTLAIVTEMELDLIPRPRERGLVLLHFNSLSASMDAVQACLEFQPSAVELMDQMLIELARGNLSLKSAMTAIQGNPAALLMVEFSGDHSDQIAAQAERLEKRLRSLPGLTGLFPALDPAVRDPLWNLRRAAVPLLLGVPGDRKPVTFVEDTAVSPTRLPEFIDRFRDLLKRHGTDGAFYGHASVGCVHIRPLLNLKDGADIRRMRAITSDVTDLVLEFGGALSGEHGDGLARSEWNRKMFGEAIYEAFRQIKQAFDPHNLFNPGKVVDAPAMTDDLRYGPDYHPAEPATLFDYSRQDGFVRSIEMCNGSGVCRKLKGGTMCPSFRATRDEKDSTRGRANALRLALAPIEDRGMKMEDRGSRIEDGSSGLRDGFRSSILNPQSSIFHSRSSESLRSQWVYDVLDLCLMCKGCKSECPSNVDMAKLKSEFLHFYYQGRARPWSHTLMSRLHQFNSVTAPVAPLVNWLQNWKLTRWLGEKIADIDRRRSLPRLHVRHFRRWHARHAAAPTAGRYGRVLLLADCFTTYYEPYIGRAAVRVLERAGYTVEPADLTCCCRPMISKGMLQESRHLIHAQLHTLVRRVGEGMPILGLEPSCLLTLRDEWPELVPGEESRRVAAAAELTESWLVKQVRAGRCDARFSTFTPDSFVVPSSGGWFRKQPKGRTTNLRQAHKPAHCLLHGHCHQKALEGIGDTVAALQLVPELQVTALDAGCCGMAGSFGYEKEHYDLSVAIANLELLPALAAEPDAIVVANGTSCRHQIKDLARRRAYHPMEVLAEQMEVEQ
jgi:FAD/FMN-containing dehydrogenase/Fe-S oxidoreductase